MGILDPLHRFCCIFLVSTNFYHCVSIKFHKRRSVSALLGAYLNVDKDYNKNSKKIGLNTFEEDVTVKSGSIVCIHYSNQWILIAMGCLMS